MRTNFWVFELSYVLADWKPAKEAGNIEGWNPEVFAHSKEVLEDLVGKLSGVSDDKGLSGDVLPSLISDQCLQY